MQYQWKIIMLISLLIALMINSIFFSLAPTEQTFNKPNEILTPQRSDTLKNSTTDQVHHVDHILEKMPFGIIAFNVPTKININETKVIELLLTPNEDLRQLKSAVKSEGEKIGANIKITNEMEAHLAGDMFTITPVNHYEKQAIFHEKSTRWLWEVSPKQTGLHHLYLTLNVFVYTDDHSAVRTIRTFNEVIGVNSTARQQLTNFFEHNWQWLWATVFLPISGWLWRHKTIKLM